MAMTISENIYQLYQSCKTERDQYTSLWQDISKFTGISVDTRYQNSPNSKSRNAQLDEFVDDPTSAISVNQFGDYLIGIMWGTGDRVFDIVPSRYVTELVDGATVQDFFSYATDQTLYHMNHPQAGYATALRPYAYDQASFGTSGIGTFPNQAFKLRLEDNALLFRNYGVDNLAIDLGKSGMVEIVFATYFWKTNRIVGEFATTGGAVDMKKVTKLPKVVQDAYNKGNYNMEFKLVFGAFPREDYAPGLQGIRGTKYRGVWFLDDSNNHKVFFDESFAERPISVCRQIVVRGETWGRSSGTMLLSSIRSVNFMFSATLEILEKMGNPALGITSNAIFGDSVLDTSPNGLTVFNQMMSDGNSPVFPLHDVGDPTGIIEFLIPYLNNKITSAFKVDALLDFNSEKDMTATESLQRYTIRGKSLAGILAQQKNERLIPDVRRSISILLGMGELGVDPAHDGARAKKLMESPRTQGRVIPDAVLEVIKSGRPWYELRFNNELEKLTRTEAVQNLVQILNSVAAIAALYPDIVEAVDWYKLLRDINDALDYNNQIILSKDDFKDAIAKLGDQRQAAMALQAAQQMAVTQKDGSAAQKNKAEALNAR